MATKRTKPVKAEKPTQKNTCGECAHGTWIEEFANKDYKGDYICLRCPYQEYAMLRVHVACKEFKPKQ